MSLKDEKELIEGVDYYFDEKSNNMVFTKEYHLKRGHCCESSCRHCPYENEPAPQKERVK
jgi:hypothetical protein